MTITTTLNFDVKTIQGEVKNEQVSLNLKIPEAYQSQDSNDKSNYLIYRALQRQLTNHRQGTRNTKTRAEVRGGGKKPWKQKGSGRARAGSNRSPLWKGGGVTFGPRPKVFKQKMNQKEWQLSLRLLLIKKATKINIIDDFAINDAKTNSFSKLLDSWTKNPKDKILFIVPDFDKSLRQSTKNIPNVQVLVANCLNIKDILNTNILFITRKSLQIIEETYHV